MHMSSVQMGEYVSTQMLIIHQWAGPSVIAQLAPDSSESVCARVLEGYASVTHVLYQ